MSDAPSGKLKEQDLNNLDINKLTPSSPQVISRQATINIDLTNEHLQRQSCPKPSKKRKISEAKSDCSIIIKTYINSEKNLDKIDAALLNCENSLKNNDNVVGSKAKLLLTKKLIPNTKNRSDNEILSTASEGPNSKCILKSGENTNNLQNDAEALESSNANQSSKTILDTAIISIPPIESGSYNFINFNSMIKSFILEGKMIDLLNDKAETAYDPKEIMSIVDDAIIHDVHFYLVRWTKWSQGFSTWEQFGALRKSQKLVIDYAREKLKRNKTKVIKTVNGLHVMLSRDIITKLFDYYRNETGLSLPVVNVDDLVSLVHGLDVGCRKTRLNRKKTLFMNLATIALKYFREKQIEDLELYETDIGVLTDSYNLVKVENNMDLEGPPNVFTYSPKCVLTNVTKLEDPPIGCSCKGNCEKSDICCNDMAGYPMPYDANKNVVVPVGSPIFECNIKCRCTQKCKNRVVQLGSKINVCIYKTRSACGWGVKTKQNIRKGQFVSEYTGEIITIEKAEERLESKYSTLDHMWNLDFNDADDYKYIIDSSHYANFTYFMNHSCNANLNVYAVWVNCLDLNLPHLALFARRDILAGEQLTIDYFSRCSVKDLKKSGIRCQCNMKNCKGYFF